MSLRDEYRAYLVTMWLLLGALLLYAAFALPACDLSVDRLSGWIPACLFVFFFGPVLVGIVGLSAVVSFVIKHDFLTAATSLAATIAFYALWWGVWRVLYGSNREFVGQTP